ncbi:DUF1273 domain-containing protein [Bacillus testis]|uniref:DUF1273 domain-containing protein n=1 Tax=Bacillus testis TaxID=1622072 RepID=UPI00067EA684|nr:DUF1273 domain-containing protein [Bacillus testis]
MKVLYVTGYKSAELGIFKNDAPEALVIKKAVHNRLQTLAEEGLQWVIISGQLGVELWAAEVVLSMMEEYPDLKLGVLTPFLEQDSKWNEKNKEYYEYILAQADLVDSISKKPYESPQQFKNRDQFLLHKSDGLLIVYDEENEGSPKFLWKAAKEYRETHEYEIMQIDFYELQQIIEEATYEHTNEWDGQ